MSRGAQRRLESAATAAIVEALRASHGPRILRLTLLQQVILKTLSLLVAPTRTSTLLHALPVALDERGLELQMHALCESGEGLLRATVASRVEEGDDDDDEGSSCRHFDLYCGGAKEEAAYVFASAGLREVCQSMLLDAHKRQVRFRLVTQYESNSVLARLLCPLDDSFIPLTKHDDLLGAIREGPGTMQSAEGEVTASSMADDPYLTSGGGSLGELSQSVPGGLAVEGGGGVPPPPSPSQLQRREAHNNPYRWLRSRNLRTSGIGGLGVSGGGGAGGSGSVRSRLGVSRLTQSAPGAAAGGAGSPRITRCGDKMHAGGEPIFASQLLPSELADPYPNEADDETAPSETPPSETPPSETSPSETSPSETSPSATRCDASSNDPSIHTPSPLSTPMTTQTASREPSPYPAPYPPPPETTPEPKPESAAPERSMPLMSISTSFSSVSGVGTAAPSSPPRYRLRALSLSLNLCVSPNRGGASSAASDRVSGASSLRASSNTISSRFSSPPTTPRPPTTQRPPTTPRPPTTLRPPTSRFELPPSMLDQLEVVRVYESMNERTPSPVDRHCTAQQFVEHYNLSADTGEQCDRQAPMARPLARPVTAGARLGGWRLSKPDSRSLMGADSLTASASSSETSFHRKAESPGRSPQYIKRLVPRRLLERFMPTSPRMSPKARPPHLKHVEGHA